MAVFKDHKINIHYLLGFILEALIAQWSLCSNNNDKQCASGGQLNRIKNIKRKLYGRAGFQLLRKIVLAKSE